MNNTPPTPEPRVLRFEQLGFGMFVHFGLYSMNHYGEWGLKINELDPLAYEKLAQSFKVDSMRPIVQTAKSAGCKYICLTTRHHEGFSLYDTKGLSDYDVMHTPTGRDLIAEFVEECRKEDIIPFLYHTTLDWHHPDFDADFDAYLDYLYNSVELLCTNYGPIGGLWFDGNWSKPDADWKENRLYRMIHRHQPEAMVINNTGLRHRGEGGDPEIDAVTFECGMPEPLDRRGMPKYLAGEMCETLSDHWGMGDDINFRSVKQMIEELCECRKAGANFLLNIGPEGDGSVSTIQRGIMECIGHWMDIYGTAIYNGRPYLSYSDKRDFLLKDATDDRVAYLFHFDPGQCRGNENVTLALAEEKATAFENVDRPVDTMVWMDSDEAIPFTQNGSTVSANLLGYPYGKSLCVRVAKVTFR